MQRYDDDAVVVLFDEVGYKTLALDVVRERSLLSRVAPTTSRRSRRRPLGPRCSQVRMTLAVGLRA